MVNKYTLGGAVLSIFLLAIFGVNRALSWLTQSTADTGAEDRIVAVNASDNEGGISPDGQSVSQATGENGNLLPLEEAGTYIQRQQSLGEDAAVADSAVAINPSTNDSFTTAQSDTAVDPQPTPEEVVNAPTPAAPAAPASPAVPALW